MCIRDRIYEELTPQLIRLIDETKHNEQLTEAQKQDEISLHMMGYVKSVSYTHLVHPQKKGELYNDGNMRIS